MKSICLVTLYLFLFLSCSKTDTLVTEQVVLFDGETINGIVVDDGPFIIDVRKGQRAFVGLEVSSYIFNNISYSIDKQGIVFIGIDRGKIKENTVLRITLSPTTLHRIALGSASTINVREPLTVNDKAFFYFTGASKAFFSETINFNDDIFLESSNASDVTFLKQIYCNKGFKASVEDASNLNIARAEILGKSDFEIEGASKMEILGSSTYGDYSFLELDGASEFKGDGFLFDKVSSHLSESSVARLGVSNNMKVELSGASLLYYKPSKNTTIEIISITGASEIKKIE